MSMNVQVVLQHVNKGAAYLWNPPCDSWVSSFAGIFFVIACVVASPVVLLLALDFTSYAIVRTLGIDHAHPTSTKPVSIPSSPPTTAATPSPSVVTPNPSKRPSNISLPTPSSIVLSQPQEYFTTPGGANLELAGVGVFSPPHSRTPSPPITRQSTELNILRGAVPTSLGGFGTYGQRDRPLNPAVESDNLRVQGTPLSRQGEHLRVPVNGGQDDARHDSSDDDDGALSTVDQVLRRRRKTGMVTPPDT